MWKKVPRTRKKEVLFSHHVESSRPSLTTVSLEVISWYIDYSLYTLPKYGAVWKLV